MNTRTLLDNIIAGNSVAAVEGFEKLMMQQLANQLEDRRINMAQSMIQNNVAEAVKPESDSEDEDDEDKDKDEDQLDEK